MAARQGHPSAQNNLGVIYANGEGVPQDYSRAVMWYWLAAVQGNSLAQRNLGSMYEHGRGVQVNRVLAHMWFNLAAASGDEEAVQRRGELEGEMRRSSSEGEIGEAQILAREWKRRKFGEDLIAEAEEIAGLRKTPSRSAAPRRGEPSQRGYFTVGSTKDEVLAIQGQPTSINNLGLYETWWYGLATVKFQNGRVTEFSNITGVLKARVISSRQSGTSEVKQGTEAAREFFEELLRQKK